MISASIADFVTVGNLISYALAIAIAIGGYFAIRSVKKDTLIKFQSETITAFQQRLEVVESDMGKLKEEKTLLRHQLETIMLALKQRGINVTIDGDLITISDASGRQSQHRRTAHKDATAPP